MSLTRRQPQGIREVAVHSLPSHPYGSQTVLGTQENLKNPSITNVKNYHKQWCTTTIWHMPIGRFRSRQYG